MSYDVGTHIDLSYLNRKSEVTAPVQKKSDFKETVSNAYEVGTQIVFKFNPQGLTAARRIPVSFA